MSGVSGSNPAFSVIFLFFFISLLLFVSISFHLFIIIIIIFSLCIFNYEFPSSCQWCSGRQIVLGRARAGCPCSSRVMAVVWNYFSRHCLLAGNCPAIICMGSTVVVPVGSLQLDDG